jgi:hypothetical protein
MAFKNLEQRFNATVNDLYAGAKLKFDGGRASTGANDDPLMVRKPGDGRFGIKQEGRSIPFNSAPRDVIRLTLFTLSVRGVAFLAKQQLLQTGNTFGQTKLINPAFVVANAVPFLHVRRHLRPVTGKLQPATLNTIKAKYNLRGNVGNPGIRDRLKSGLKSLAQPFTDTINAIRAPRDVGEEGGRIPPSELIGGIGGQDDGWDKSRPEIGTVTNQALAQRARFQADTDRFFRDFGGGIQGQRRGPPSDTVPKGLLLLEANSQPFLKYFTSDTESIRTRIPDELNARDRAADARTNRRRISYIRDPLNTEKDDGRFAKTLSRYSILPSAGLLGNESVKDEAGNKIDPILISFAMGNDAHVQFRAFIRDINQTANPEYKTYQYVGRIEKFISYITVQREINFKLDILAMSKDELDVVWKRINYLTSLVFPYGVNRGILQPNIVRFTIGKMFEDQPAYVTSLSTTFNEISESWDIDREVPIAATVNIGFNIIEKRTMTANSAFYKISEEDQGNDPVIISRGE